MSEILAATALAVAALMGTTWLVSLILRDASIADIVWGLGFTLVAWVAHANAPAPGRAGLALATLTTLWGLRLAAYLAWRNVGKPEDYRYAAMRERWGNRFPWVSLVTVFGLQGLLLWVVSLPVQAGQQGTQDLGALAGLGIAIWAVGLFFETVGDVQLARFKAEPANAGRVLDRGLWRYTRHPNYFGDFLVWWGLYLVALDAGAWWTAIGPAVMTALLLRYSGVGLLEQTIGQRRPGYADYVRRTNAFFPGPPRPDDAG